MLVTDFDYELPESLIAQQPLPDRAASRLLVVHREEARIEDRSFRDLPEFIRDGDCLVVNDSRVFPSRLFGKRPAGEGRIEVFLLRPLEDDLTWEALVRPGRKVPVGEHLSFGAALSARVVSRGEHGVRVLEFDAPGGNVHQEIEKLGHVPLPPYIRRADLASDRDRYQTVYAQNSGSVAAPTAGLHFTPEILDRCRAAGAELARVTLHVGLGTFAPVHAERTEDVRLHSERFSIAPPEFEKITAAKRRIAIGTTSVRAVESAATFDTLHGETSIFISPPYTFRYTDVLLTNFHLPKSSLLMLVAAFGGIDLIIEAYKHAVASRYRFFSYGDCMLIL